MGSAPAVPPFRGKRFTHVFLSTWYAKCQLAPTPQLFQTLQKFRRKPDEILSVRAPVYSQNWIKYIYENELWVSGFCVGLAREVQRTINFIIIRLYKNKVYICNQQGNIIHKSLKKNTNEQSKINWKNQ